MSSQVQNELIATVCVAELDEREQANVLCITVLGRSRLDRQWRTSQFKEECQCLIRRPTKDGSKDASLEVGMDGGKRRVVFELDWPLREKQLIEALNLAGGHISRTHATTSKTRNWLTGLLGGLSRARPSLASPRPEATGPASDLRGVINRYLDRFGLTSQRGLARNILLVGSPGSGKTTAITSVSTRNLRTTEVPACDSLGNVKGTTTISIDYGECETGPITLRLFGTPGQLRFAHMIDQTLRSCDAALALVDLTSPDPIADLQRYGELIADFGVRGGRPLLIGMTHMDVGRMPRNFRQQLTTLLRGQSTPTLPLDPRNPDSVRRALSLLARSVDRPARSAGMIRQQANAARRLGTPETS